MWTERSIRPTPDAAIGPSTLELIDEWTARGIVTSEQAARMRASLPVLVPSRSSSQRLLGTALAEALGYVGAVIGLVATILILAYYWADLSTAARLGLVGAAALVLLAGGAAVPSGMQAVGTRLRSALWVASTAAVAGFLGLVAAEVIDLGAADALVLTTAGTTTCAAALWALHRHLPQQVVTMVGVMATVAAVIGDLAEPDTLPAVGAWGVAAVWALLGWGLVLRPHRAVMLIASAALVVSAAFTMGDDAGIVLALATVAVVVLLGSLFGDLLLLLLGAGGTLLVLPAAVGTWFPDTVAAPVSLLVVGAALVAAAVWTARRRRYAVQPDRPDHSTGRPIAAVGAAAVVAVVTTLVVLVTAVM